MKILRHYFLKLLTQNAVFTLLTLLGLYGFFDVLSEVSDLGKSGYGVKQMLTYVFLLMPNHAYELMPLAVLISVMITMTQLVMSSEYTVIRTSGVTLKQVAGILFMFGVMFAILTVLLGEFIAPWSTQQAEKGKLAATHSMVAQEFRSGIWVKDNQNFINVREMLPNTTLIGLHVFTYDKDFHLVRVRYAETGYYVHSQKSWQLNNVYETVFEKDQVLTHYYRGLTWRSVIEPSILTVLLVVPEQMSALNLITYIKHLRDNKQQTQRYDIALWSKLFYPLACISMALVALAFMPRQRRNGQLGVRLFLGVCIGVAFHFVNRLFSHLGLLYNWNPALSATLPTILFLCIGIVIILRQERR